MVGTEGDGYGGRLDARRSRRVAGVRRSVAWQRRYAVRRGHDDHLYRRVLADRDRRDPCDLRFTDSPYPSGVGRGNIRRTLAGYDDPRNPADRRRRVQSVQSVRADDRNRD